MVRAPPPLGDLASGAGERSRIAFEHHRSAGIEAHPRASFYTVYRSTVAWPGLICPVQRLIACGHGSGRVAGLKRPYHHGDLPAALLRAAEEILDAEGLPALTLRAVARRAGVSHMAPAPHFGDLTGLLSELAALGYRRFNRALWQAQEEPGRRSVAGAAAQAYVAFARDAPAMFLLMFRSERLDFTRPALAEAAAEASRLLMRTTGGQGLGGGQDSDGLAGIGRAVANWSVVHGFAVLLIDGRLAGVLASPDCNGDVEALLDLALSN